MFQNKTFETDVDTSLLGTHLQISEIHTNDVTGFTLIKFEFISGTNDIQLLVENINIDMDMTSELKFSKLPTAKISNLVISGLDINLNISSVPLADNVRYQLAVASFFQIDDLDIKFKPAYI